MQPVLTSSSVAESGRTVSVNVDYSPVDGLNPSVGDPVTGFTASRNGQPVAVQAAEMDGGTESRQVILTLAEAVHVGDVVTVHYHQGTGNIESAGESAGTQTLTAVNGSAVPAPGDGDYWATYLLWDFRPQPPVPVTGDALNHTIQIRNGGGELVPLYDVPLDNGDGSYSERIPVSLLGNLTAVIAETSTAGLTLIPPRNISRGGSGGGLTGPTSCQVTFVDGASAPVPLVDYTVTGQGSSRSGNNGVATFGLAPGTYTLVGRMTGGVVFPNTTLNVGTSALVLTVQGTNVQITPSSDPETTNAVTTVIGPGGVIVGETCYFQLVTPPRTGSTAGRAWLRTNYSAVSGTGGVVQVLLPRACIFKAKVGANGPWSAPFDTGADPTCQVPELVGRPSA